MADLLQLDWPGTARELTLLSLVVLAGGLFVVTLAFSAYAVLLRLRNDRREGRRAQLAARWESALLTALADPTEIPALHALVDDRRRLHFVGFVLEFARRVRGEETNILRAVARPYLAPIVQRAQSDRVERRARAVQTLGTLGLPEHADVVIAALEDASPLVAMVAARALAKEQEPRYAHAVLAKVHRFGVWNRPYLASMLSAMGPTVSEGLRKGLADSDGDPWVRSVFAEALLLQKDFEAGDVAAEVAATAERRALLASTLRLLAEVGRPAHLSVIRERCMSHDGVVRSQALLALGRLGVREDLPMLLAAMDDPFAWAALYAARGVRDSGGRELLVRTVEAGGRKGQLAAQVLAEQAAP